MPLFKSLSSSLQKNSGSNTSVNKLKIPLPVNPNCNPNNYSVHDFEIMRTLGTGSFGRVHLVKLKKTGEYFAMKAMKKSEVVRLKQVEHTMNERNLLASVNFPFLVNVVCTMQDSLHLFVVMEYVMGGELFSILRKAQVNAGLIHRDFPTMLQSSMLLKLFWLLSICILGTLCTGI